MGSNNQSFDFVVVGGGTAGCLLAHRLATASSKPSVLLLETGGLADDETHRPPFLRFLNAYTRPDLDHGYSTVPQKSLGGKSLPYIRGKGLGGSSLSNFLCYTRGASADYDRWADLVGSQDWVWDNLKRSFQKVERFTGGVPTEFKGYAKPDLESYGLDGFVGVSLPDKWEKETTTTIDALLELGYPKNVDANSGNPVGVGLCANSIYQGQRSTSGSSLALATKSPNLTIWTESRATKIKFDGKRAVGVELSDGRSVTASKELILAAGSIDTPKLLKLSGVGPAAELVEHGIEIVQDLPGVGQNASDHVGVFIAHLASGEFSDRVPFLLSPEQQAAANRLWAASKTGPLTEHFNSLGTAFVKEEAWYDSAEFKDLPEQEQQFIKKPNVPQIEYILNCPLVAPAYNLTDPTVSFMSTAIILMNPQSRGTVKLASSNPRDAPLIDFEYMSHPYDRATLISGIRKAMHFHETKTLRKYWKASINVPKSESDEDIFEFIKDNITPVWHANGTARMGKVGDQNACVDANLLVQGLEGLRIADLSICPTMPNNHTQATAYVIGQVAADKIIDKYGL